MIITSSFAGVGTGGGGGKVVKPGESRILQGFGDNEIQIKPGMIQGLDTLIIDDRFINFDALENYRLNDRSKLQEANRKILLKELQPHIMEVTLRDGSVINFN